MGSKAKRSYMITTLAGRISHISLLSNFIYIRMLARVKSFPHSLARAETKAALINAAILVSESKQPGSSARLHSSPLPFSTPRGREEGGTREGRGERADRVLEGEDISSLKRKL